MKHLVLKIVFTVLFVASAAAWGATGTAIGANLVANGDFEGAGKEGEGPEFWETAGDAGVKQKLSREQGRAGGYCARLDCTEYSGSGPATHAMICQRGKVSVRKDRWYRLTFWAKTALNKHGGILVGLNATKPWHDAGLAAACSPGASWESFEFLFRATDDILDGASRLQIYFHGTGTLWLDDVELVEVDFHPEWYPQIATEGVKNFVPNSSFECGAANWGSYQQKNAGWGAGSLFRLEGTLDPKNGSHGPTALRIALSTKDAPVSYFDYFKAVAEPVRQALAANLGWFKVRPGEPLTLSAYMKADAEGVVGKLGAMQAQGGFQSREVRVGTQWQRFEFTFTPKQEFCYIAAGLDLDASKRAAAVLWVDAIQLERGTKATAYEPRQAVESFVETDQPGNLFTNAAQGMKFTVRAYNDSGASQHVAGRFIVKDFFDREIGTSEVKFLVEAKSRGSVVYERAKDLQGFFRATWDSGACSNSLRCAQIIPHTSGDSPIGMNHAYPWDYLVREAQLGGIAWWRDWSAKWHIVEPEKGRFNFAEPDVQINRVLKEGGNVLVLLPFPSSAWATTYVPGPLSKADDHYRQVMPYAFKPANLNDFSNYVAATALHYHDRAPTFHILNEPVYTGYALPKSKGHTMADYLRLLETAQQAIKRVDARATVVGGIASQPTAALVQQFVTDGGLKFVDVVDLHMYNQPAPGEKFEEDFAQYVELMRQYGGVKPMWITEFGAYADDDPANVPMTVGDPTMSKCTWKNERAASEYIVKFTAVSFAYGTRKIFFHAGTVAAINASSAGGIFFEYGGEPRKMYAAVAALDRLLGVPQESAGIVHQNGLFAYKFQTKHGAVAIAWNSAEKAQTLQPGAGIEAYDVMGNKLPAGPIAVGSSPVYLVHAKGDLGALDRALGAK